MFFDVGLTIDPVTGRGDVSFVNGDLVIDETPATYLICCLLTDRRAQSDDVLPVDEIAPRAPIFNARRGQVCDALDPNGELMGSRLWLLSRAKQTEDTRLAAISYAKQATANIGRFTTDTVVISASWLRKGVLGLVTKVGSTTVVLPMAVT